MYVRAKVVLEEEGERFNLYGSTWKNVYRMLLDQPIGIPVCILDFKDINCPKLEKILNVKGISCPKLEKNQLTSATFFLMPKHSDIRYYAGPNHNLLVIYDLQQSNLLTRLYVPESRLAREAQSNFLQSSGGNIDVDVYTGMKEATGMFLQVVSQYLGR